MPKEYGTPGPRAIYPDICTSRSLAACSLAAQILFDRLIAQADDQGRIEGDAAVIKSLCVPLIVEIPAIGVGRGSKRVAGIDELLAELEAEELVVRYEIGRARLVQVITWWRWQQGQRRAYPSRWPAPEGWTDAIYGRTTNDQASYKAWLDAAQRGTAPHNAAWRGDMPHNAAFSRTRVAAQARAAPADSGALTGADSTPNPRGAGATDETPLENGANPRAQGTNPRAVAAREREGKSYRRNQRQLAYLRGALTEDQRAEMNRRDAPLEEIPDYAEHLARLRAEKDALSPLAEATELEAWAR